MPLSKMLIMLSNVWHRVLGSQSHKQLSIQQFLMGFENVPRLLYLFCLFTCFERGATLEQQMVYSE